jgi:hypothetical protein
VGPVLDEALLARVRAARPPRLRFEQLARGGPSPWWPPPLVADRREIGGQRERRIAEHGDGLREPADSLRMAAEPGDHVAPDGFRRDRRDLLPALGAQRNVAQAKAGGQLADEERLSAVWACTASTASSLGSASLARRSSARTASRLSGAGLRNSVSG